MRKHITRNNHFCSQNLPTTISFDSQCCYSINTRKEAQERWRAWLASMQTIFWVASSIQSTTTLQQSLKLNQAAYSSAV